MKPSQLIIPTVTGILGLALGFALAPSIRTAESGSEAPSAAAKSKRHPSAELGGITSEESRNTAAPTRSRDRGEDKKPKEPRVSIPLKTMVGILKEGEFKHSSGFDHLSTAMEKSLILLGATDREREEVMGLVTKSKEEILAAENTHLKLGEVTAERIRIDMSGMQGPAEEITKRTQDGIRAALPPDVAEGLLSAISWEKYYPVDPSTSATLEVTRNSSGTLNAWRTSTSLGSGSGSGSYGLGKLNGKFKDDGTPLPADEVFTGVLGDRWKPILKGLTILPKDEL